MASGKKGNGGGSREKEKGRKKEKTEKERKISRVCSSFLVPDFYSFLNESI